MTSSARSSSTVQDRYNVMQLPVGDVATLVVAASDLSALLAWGLHGTDVGFAPHRVKLESFEV